MNTLKFISLGSGSSGNCYVLWSPTTCITIDAGLGIRTLKRSLQTAGLDLSMIDATLVTHDHADHIKAVGYMAKDYHIPIYATELVHSGINANYSICIKVAPESQKVIVKDKPFEIGDLRITAFDVPHDSTDCCGYRIEGCGTSITIITDVGHASSTVAAHVRRANHLVIEANHDVEMLRNGPYPAYLKGRITSGRGHLSNMACGQVLADNATPALRHVWLCHLSEENNHPELARKTVDSVLRSYGIITPKDFILEVLRRKIPSEIYELTPLN